MAALSTLFVYGTLCKPAMRRRVLGRAVGTVQAVLKGYRRVNGKWPYLVKKRGGSVKGEILQGLTSRDFKRLDAYEDVAIGLYRRVRLNINGRKHFIYLPNLSRWPAGWKK